MSRVTLRSSIASPHLVGRRVLAKGTTKGDLQRDRDDVFNTISAVCCNMSISSGAVYTRSPKPISKIASSVHEVAFLIRAEVSQAERVSGENRERLAVERNREEMAYSGRDMSRVFGPCENMSLGYIYSSDERLSW
jgi:hypothetical protein